MKFLNTGKWLMKKQNDGRQTAGAGGAETGLTLTMYG